MPERKAERNDSGPGRIAELSPDPAELAQRQAEVCRLFGNPTRIQILWALLEQEMNVSDLAAAVQASLQSTSQHLRLMRDKGILNSRRAGNAVYYRIQPQEYLVACRLLEIAPSVEHTELPEHAMIGSN